MQQAEQATSSERIDRAGQCESWLDMRDGQRVFVRDWPLARARGAVLLAHGLGEHSGRYQGLAAWFNQRGYAVRGYDQRGHGQSGGRRGGLRRADDLLEDLAAVYRDYAGRQPHAPLLLGHSMGGLVALRAVLDGAVTPPALVLSSPALRSRESPRMIRLAQVLGRWLPHLPLRSALDATKLSHDPGVAAGYREDPLRHGWITPRLADFIFREGEACIAEAASLEVPTLLLVAEGDELVDPAGSRAFARAAAPTGQLTTRFFAALYHELFNETEPGRSQVLMQLGDWLGRQLHR